MKKTKSGFTIVELLIVIVVIGILAAITIVAYSGFQQRARNQAKISAANALVKMIDAYTITTGNTLPGIPFCLPAGHKDTNSDGIGDCGDVTTTTSSNSEKAGSTAALASAGITNLSFPLDVVTSTTSTKFAGIQLTYGSGGDGIGGVLQPYFLYFMIEGSDQDCKSGYSVSATGPSGLTAMTYGRNRGYANGVTYCAYTTKHASSL